MQTCEAIAEVNKWAIPAILLLERWLGVTDKVKSGSILEFLQRIIFRQPIKEAKTQETQVELLKGVKFEYKEGAAVVTLLEGNIEVKVKAAAALNPILDGLSSKVSTGEIDLIKGTDIDKELVLKIISAIKAEVNK